MVRKSVSKSLLTGSICIFSLVFLCAMGKLRSLKPYIIVSDGQAKATIVTGENPSKVESLAAQELQDYFLKISGAKVAIKTDNSDIEGNCILIGRTRFTPASKVRITPTDPGREGFKIKTSGRYLVVAGSDDLGTLYAAYELLEMLGVRWFLPDPLGEVVPSKKTIEMPALDIKQKPDFIMRRFGRGQWRFRIKCNRPSDELGVGFNVQPGIYHSQSKLLPVSEYFPKHPEYFALVDGRRCSDKEAKLCTSNPEVVREVAKNMARMLDQDSSIDLIGLSPTDGMYYCECENCRALDETVGSRDQEMSRRMLIFYNQVAQELTKTHPDARILAGAYHIYNRPPKDKTLKAHPNLCLVICHYTRYCNLHPVNDASCPLNRNFRQLLLDWKKLIPDIYLYEYYQTYQWLQLPCPLVHSITEDIPYFKQLGIKGLYTQYGNIWNNYLNYYVAAKLLWDTDTDTDVQALLDDFYEKFFQEAAGPMKKYYTTLEETVANCGLHMCTCDLKKRDIEAHKIFTPAVLQQLTGFLAEAKRMARDDKVKGRLEKIETSLGYTKEFMEYLALKRQALKAEDKQLRDKLAKKALHKLESLYEDVKNNPQKYDGIIKRYSNWRKYLQQCREWATNN